MTPHEQEQNWFNGTGDKVAGDIEESFARNLGHCPKFCLVMWSDDGNAYLIRNADDETIKTGLGIVLSDFEMIRSGLTN